MRILAFADNSSETGRCLCSVVEKAARNNDLQVYDDFTVFSRNLQAPSSAKSETIAVLLARSRDDLKIFKDLLDRVFSDYRIILILPDREFETISLGHQLRPRYFSYADGDFSEIGEVLENMLKIKIPSRTALTHS